MNRVQVLLLAYLISVLLLAIDWRFYVSLKHKAPFLLGDNEELSEKIRLFGHIQPAI